MIWNSGKTTLGGTSIFIWARMRSGGLRVSWNSYANIIPALFTTLSSWSSVLCMVKVFKKDTNELLGRISEEELAFLKDQLEEEGVADHDYYLRRETIDEFAASAGATEHLVTVLKTGLRNDEAVEIRWERDV